MDKFQVLKSINRTVPKVLIFSTASIEGEEEADPQDVE
jgi:hypothetical protein